MILTGCQVVQVLCVRHKTVRYSLQMEKIEDGVLYVFILFGRRDPVLLRGNPHWKVLGESVLSHILMHSTHSFTS